MLSLLSKPFEFLLFLRNELYLKGFFRRCKPEGIKVVSVGNLSVGGTGKTPTVLELAKILTSRGYKVTVLLRGYRRRTKGTLLVSDGKKTFLEVFDAGDEAYLYAKLLNGVPVAVSENRCKGAELLKRFSPDVLLLDDALQHVRMGRDFDIVILTPRDLEDRVLPFGRLREPLSVLKLKGDYCLFSKTEKEPRLEELCLSFGKPFGYLKVKGYKLLNPRSGKSVSPSELKGLKVGAVSALGDNRLFISAVEKLLKPHGVELKEIRTYNDHFDYRNFHPAGVDVWITTYKDYFKLEKRFGGEAFLVLERLIELPQNLIERLFELL